VGVGRNPGRPSKRDDSLADRLVALLAAGVPLAEAAAVGFDRKTLSTWRRRAWSRDPRDAP
jgi:hypothetical protein